MSVPFEQTILPGYCQCGCGQTTVIADRNRLESGIIKGQPRPYVLGHNRRTKNGGPKQTPNTKWCAGCSKSKNRENFYKNAASQDGLGPRCKPCMTVLQREYRQKNRAKLNEYARKRRLAKTYGITSDEYSQLLESQQGKCAVCSATETRTRAGNTDLLSIDHDHATGKVRGLLCNNCNRALGLLDDDPEILHSAIAYLTNGHPE